MTGDTVWLVLDESDDAPELVLAVFGNKRDAQAFFDSLTPSEEQTFAFGEYALGSTFRDGGRRYHS
ncbi:MAG: hypothetical protein QOI51_1701 [Nocardioidaceae bacterium]|nr:hypothetical protein [Nocardioidaceae bacterium]